MKPGREIRKSGVVQVLKTKKSEKRLIYLFTDIILALKMRSPTNLKFKYFIPYGEMDLYAKKNAEGINLKLH